MNRDRKVFVFGIDGATFTLMRKWVADGELPTIGWIMDHGTAAVSQSTIPPVSCPAWKSFATGMNPGKLGVFDLVHKEPGTYTIVPSRADMVLAPDVWDILSAKGYTVGVFNVPVTYPPHKVNGFIVPGMLGNTEAPDFTYPPELKQEIEQVLGTPYLIEADEEGQGLDAWLKKEYAVTEMKVNVAKYLLTHKEWDFFITVFCETDRVQHIFWHYMDKNHPRYTPSHLEHAIKDSYKRMDRFLKECIDLLEDDTTIIVMSDHGFGPVQGSFRLNQWFFSQKYLSLTEESMKAFFDDIARRFLKKEQPEPLKEQPRDQPISTTIGDAYTIDWSKTKVYSTRIGNVYLNVKGREPEGIIEMGKEYEDTRNQLINDLSALVHPKTKQPLNVTVRKKEEVYSGEYFGDAPDLMVSIEGYFVEPGFGPMWVGLRGEGGYATGGHLIEGIFIACGRDIKSNQWIDPISLVDIAPIILHIMGMPVSSDMDGTVLLSLFEEGSPPASRDITISPPLVTRSQEKPSSFQHSEDDEKVLKRLRDLGYLE